MAIHKHNFRRLVSKSEHLPGDGSGETVTVFACSKAGCTAEEKVVRKYAPGSKKPTEIHIITEGG